MSEWLKKLFGRIRRPEVGAVSALNSLSGSRGGQAWYVRLLSSGSWHLLGLVVLVTFLPVPKQVHLERWNIFYFIVAYGAYVLLLEFASRTAPEHYDGHSFNLLRVVANVVAVTALIYISPGAGTYFWCLYALPIFQSHLYLRTHGAAAVTAAVTALYWMTSLTTAASAPADYTTVALNSLLLVVLSLGLQWIFGAVRENRELEFRVMNALWQISMDIAAQTERRKLLKTIIQRSVTLLDAKGGGIYEYDPQRRELTVVADWGGKQSIVGHKLKEGEGMAGRVVRGQPLRVDDYSTWPHRCPELEPGLFRAVVEVPLRLPRGPIGVLYVTDDKEKRTFNQRDELILTLLASHAAITMNNVGTFEQREKMVVQLELLDRLSAKVSRALSLEEILRDTLSETLRAVGTGDGSIMVYDPVQEMLEIKAWVFNGETRSGKEHQKFKLGEGIAGHVAETRIPYNCPDTSTDELFAYSEAGQNFRSILSVPIISNGKVVCIINADSRTPNYFKDSDIGILSAIADHVAVAIEAQLLRDVGLSLAADEPGDLYAKIVESAYALTGSDVSTIFLQDDETGGIFRAAAFPPTEGRHDGGVRKDGLTQKILSSGEPEHIKDYQNYEGAKPELKRKGIETLYGMPLKVRGGDEHETIGVLYASRKLARDYTDRDVQILSGLANQAAIAVKKARLYRDVLRERDRLARSDHFRESLLANAFDAIIAIDEHGIVKEFNTGAERILGYSREEALGGSVKRFYTSVDDAREVMRQLRENKGRLVNHFVNARTKAGTTVPIRLSVSLLEDGTVGFFRDQRSIVDVRRHLDRLRTPPDSGEDEAESYGVRQVAENIAAHALEALRVGPERVDSVSLYIYEPESKQVRLPPVRLGLLHEGVGGLDVGPDSAVKKIIFSGDDVYRDDVYFTESALRDVMLGGDFADREELCAAAAGPLRVMNRTVGVMFCNFRSPLTFTDEWKDLIREFMGDAAIAIDHAQLYEDLRKYAELLHELYRVSSRLTNDFTEDQMLDGIVHQARELTGARYGALGVFDQNRKLSKFIPSGMTEEDEESIGHWPTGEGLLGHLLSGKDSIRDHNISDDHRFTGFPPGHPTMKSFLGLPILVRRVPRGNIYIGDKENADSFNEIDELILGMLANIAAFVIGNVNARAEADTRKAITFAFLLLSHWSREVRRMGAEFSAELSELAAAPGATPAAAAVLKKISRHALTLHAPLIHMQAGIRREMTDMVDLSQELRELKGELEEEEGVRISVEDLDPACNIRGSNSQLLRIAFTILIQNAARAIRARGVPGEIRLECRVKGDRVQGTVTDNGCGIPEKIQERLFKEVVSGDHVTHNREGLGYASLAVAMVIRDLHNGHVGIYDSRPGRTVIEFSIPTERS